MAEAVRPRKKHRKKKDGKTSKKLADVDDVLQCVQDAEEEQEKKQELFVDQEETAMEEKTASADAPTQDKGGRTDALELVSPETECTGQEIDAGGSCTLEDHAQHEVAEDEVLAGENSRVNARNEAPASGGMSRTEESETLSVQEDRSEGQPGAEIVSTECSNVGIVLGDSDGEAVAKSQEVLDQPATSEEGGVSSTSEKIQDGGEADLMSTENLGLAEADAKAAPNQEATHSLEGITEDEGADYSLTKGREGESGTLEAGNNPASSTLPVCEQASEGVPQPSELTSEQGREKTDMPPQEMIVEQILEMATAPPEQEANAQTETHPAADEVGNQHPLYVGPQHLTSTEPSVMSAGNTKQHEGSSQRVMPSEIADTSGPSVRQEGCKIPKTTPMTEAQLEMYYHNPKLKLQEKFVEDFIQDCNIERHEFYELVFNYFKARNNMLTLRADIDTLQQEYVSLKERLWTTTDHFILAKGMCADNIVVKENYAYQLANYNPDVHKDLDRLMKYTRSNYHDTYALCSYTAQLSKLQIESYIHQLFVRNPLLASVKEGAPITAELSADSLEQLGQLKQCITVLFAFQRRPVNDVEFLKNSRGWLSRMIGTLLRLATLDDHLFVLAHILRCPAGIDQWAASYLQVVMPSVSPLEGAVVERWPYSLGNPLLDHFLNVLAFFMRPVKYRDEFLTKMKKVLSPDTPGGTGPFNWTLLDEDGEEDEDTDNTLLNENDLVAILVQFPFDKMFKHVLQITDSDGEASYSIDRTGSHHVIQLIAFATSLIQILHQGVLTFNRSRYRQFVKRTGRLIRHSVQQVSDHWLNYRSWRRDVCQDADNTRPSMEPYDLQHSIASLQMEFDEFFFRATKCIMSAPRLGTWQFMTDMPYTSLSPAMMWRLLWYLHQDDMNLLALEPGTENTDCYKWNLSDPRNRDRFIHKLMDMPMSEVIYLLTTFANMSSARPAKEQTFITFVVEEIFELAYLSTHTREFCSKIGRELLAAIATTHPFIISTLLRQVRDSSKEVGSVSLYLFRGLPLHLWQPEDDDIHLIRDWLLGYELAKADNQLARLVLSKMNWGCNEQENTLFLDISLHRSTAILVVEKYIKVLAAKSPGAMRLGTGPFSSQEHAFDLWAWELVPKLRLHRLHQPLPTLLTSSQGVADDRFGALPDPGIDTKLYPLQKALQMNAAIGCFVAVAMTVTGHSIGNFITYGIPNMYTLIQAGCQRFCLPLLAVVVPMFLDQKHPDYLLTNEKFLTIVHRILLADHQTPQTTAKGVPSIPGDTTKLFAGMVLTQMQRALSPSCGALAAEAVLEFWLQLLTSNPGWHYDPIICYILDMVVASTFCNKGGCSKVEEVLLTQYKDQKSDIKPQGFLSSMLSFVSSGTPLPSLLEKQSLERPWLAYCILSAETRTLDGMGLLQEVSRELFQDLAATPDVALKRACQKLRLDYAVPAARLPIYRWAQLALETDINHPLLPVIWQRFFTTYLERAKAETGASQRSSVGQRYFQSLTNLTYLKRLKRRLRQTADHHHEAGRKKPEPKPSPSSTSLASGDQDAASEEDGKMDWAEGGDFEAEVEHHQNLLQLYQMYLLWLEEPLLHDASLYLPSLPTQYEAEKLSRIFNGDQDLWMEYANVNLANHQTAALVSMWVNVSQPDASATAFSQRLTSEQEQIDTATSRILNRLTHYETRQDAPPVVPIYPPVPDVPKELLVNNHAMLVFLQDDIKQLLYYAETFSERENRNVVLDCEYLELTPDLYVNKETQVQFQIACKSSFNPMHKCKGPAVTTIMHKSKQANNMVLRRIDENRAEFKQLSIESLSPPPAAVVVSAVHIENAITDLIHLCRGLVDSSAEFEAVKQTGVSLLYHLGNQMSESARHYPPTRQFFSSCIEILGQEFIRPYPDQAQPLLSAILTNHNLAGLLAPNLAPNHCGESFLQMYTEVVRVGITDEPDTAFMLLTKFDPCQWLNNCQPPLAMRSQFIEVIGEALVNCGLEMDNQTMMMFEIYRSHLQAMLKHQFPEHYADVLRLLLKGSEERSLHVDIWTDTLVSLSCPVLALSHDEVTSDQVKELIKTHPILSLQQLQDTIEWLTTYFSRQRSSNPQCGQFGLHSNWKQYHQPLVSFMGYIVMNAIILEAHRVTAANLDAEQAVRHVWTLVSGLFYPWIVALEVPSPTNPAVKQLLPPWVEGDRAPASCMVSLFAHAICCIQAQFQGYLSPELLNCLSLLWPFYNNTLARKGLRDDILTTYHQHLVLLPWNQFYPDLIAMELMIRVFEDKGKTCLLFLGDIFPCMQWRQISESYCQGTDAATSSGFLSYLLSLLVIFLNDDAIMSAQDRSMRHLVAQAQEFPWQLLDIGSYNCAATWQIDRCDPKCVLDWVNRQGDSSVSLMREVARFNAPSASDTSDDVAKRTSYVNLVVQLLCKCSSLDGTQKDWFPSPVQRLLNDIELQATAGGSIAVRQQELVTLLSSLLTLLNSCSPIHGAPDAILDAILTWFEASTGSALGVPCITAACRTLASVRHSALVIEACIDANFSTNMDLSPDPSRGWTSVLEVLQVPELTHDAFLAECCRQGALLTLYAYLSQRSPQCRSVEEEYTLYTELVDWCVKCRLRPANEAKVFLWWHKALQMTLHQIDFGSPHWTMSRSLNNLVPSMMTLGEDRSSSGLLGAIGFGRQSELSYRFRVISRSMAALISAQVLRNGSIRLAPNDPGALSRHRDTQVQSPTSPDAPKPSSLAYTALKQLDAVIDNKNYAGLTEHARHARDLVLDPSKCLKDALQLLSQLVTVMFPEKHYLSVIRTI